MRIGWKQGYEIGIPKIDEQHQELLALVNKLLEHGEKHSG
jgi:hemerythrin